MIKAKKTFSLLALLLAGVTAVQAQSGTITFKDGSANDFSGGLLYTGTQDATLSRGKPNNNFGSGSGVVFSSTTYAGLLKFNLTSFPDTVSSVTNAKVRLGMQAGNATNAGTPITIKVYQLNAANADWNEGTGFDVAATEGEVAWNFKAKGAAGQPDVLWASGGAFSSADYGATEVGTYDFVLTTGVQYIEIDLSGSMIANWINNPSSNGGLVFVSDSSIGATFYGSNNTFAPSRPELTFDYVLGPPVPESSTTALVAGIIAFAAVGYLRRRKAAR